MNRRNGNIKEVGHTFLARLGKTRLRPGGKQATDRLLAQKNIKRYGLEEKLSVQQGNAFKLPFAAEIFDIVINEAMLTMFA